MIDLLKYLVAMTIGLLLGYWLFSSSSSELDAEITNSEVDSTARQLVDTLPQPEATTIRSFPKTQMSDTKPVSNTEERALKQLVAHQKQTIADLNAQLNLLKDSLAIAKAEDDTLKEEERGMEVLSMKDFENQLKADFTDRFKGKAIEISGDQLESIRKAYEGDTSKTDWSVDFENKVVDFIGRADPNSMHYLDEVGCNKSMCRLKVQSAEGDQWQKIYANMTKQEWYNSMTLVEETNEAGSFVYYIPNPNNM